MAVSLERPVPLPIPTPGDAPTPRAGEGDPEVRRVAELSPGERGLVGGRVRERFDDADGRPLALVGDAFDVATVALPASAELVPGDHVVLDCEHLGARLVCHHVRELHRPARAPARSAHALPAASETDRFTHRAVAARLAHRARVTRLVRAFFDARGYLEVETPACVPSPGLDLHLDAFELSRGAAPYLSTSPEYQMKRLLAGGIHRSYQLARCFRVGEEGARHNPEFTMLEWYRAFGTLTDLMDDTEALVRSIVLESTGRATLCRGDVTHDLATPFVRMSVREAFERFAGVGERAFFELAAHDEARFFERLSFEVEPALAKLGAGVFLHHFPLSMASLARRSPHDARVAERVELYVGGVELSNGFGELCDPTEQRARFSRDRALRDLAGKPIYPVDERFLAALDEGMPPAYGNALGMDRLTLLTLPEGARIADVLAFPVEWL
jgi:lysyl-tRNA synthetase class 2